MSSFDAIRPFKDEEVPLAIKKFGTHPMIKALLHFTFPEKAQEEIQQILNSCKSIRDFQTNVIYKSVRSVLEKSSEGFTMEGFDKLIPEKPYLFISNHRDIILDTSLLNVALFENNLVMTASAIGDNLVQKPFLLALSRLNRNFLIRRGLSPREMLQSSKTVSAYIRSLLYQDKRSVWIAQREGRTKDGNDITQQGVLKMLALAGDQEEVMDYFKKLNIVPVSISYEYDPTDILKMPELMAKHYDEEYKKTNNEDFNSILKGALGKKKRIHIKVGRVLDEELDVIKHTGEPFNKQLQLLAETLDKAIHNNYKLWPSNYIAHDMLCNKQSFSNRYTDKELRQFERRIARRVDQENEVAVRNFLNMYASPVINSLKENE